MLCNISGQPPEEPVVSKKTGHLFEKRLITKYLEQHGKCPLTEQDMTADDLMEIQSSKVVKPRPAQAASIPGLLSLFQNEWDALMIETYTLKQHLDTVRQELAHALYQHDAACRVIARLIKERDTARLQLSQFEARIEQVRQEQKPAGGGPTAEQDETMEPAEEEGKLSAAVLKKMGDMSQQLKTKRKKRQVSETLVNVEYLERFEETASVSLHSTVPPGVLCLDIHPNDNKILTGGVDGDCVVYDRFSGQKTHALKGHSKPVRRVAFHPAASICLSAGDDTTVRIWSVPEEGNARVEMVLREHKGEVRGLTLNATSDYVVTAGGDNMWAFTDIQSGNTLARVRGDDGDDPATAGFTCAQFHPDGMILGTGTRQNTIVIWDLKTLSNVATFPGHNGAITGMSFSENGFYLSTASVDGTVKLWDLRKLVNFRTLLQDSTNPTPINSVQFDYSGSYLAVAGDSVKMFLMKEYSEIKTLYKHTSTVTDVKWGQDARWLCSASLDRQVKIFNAT